MVVVSVFAVIAVVFHFAGGHAHHGGAGAAVLAADVGGDEGGAGGVEFGFGEGEVGVAAGEDVGAVGHAGAASQRSLGMGANFRIDHRAPQSVNSRGRWSSGRRSCGGSGFWSRW